MNFYLSNLYNLQNLIINTFYILLNLNELNHNFNK